MKIIKQSWEFLTVPDGEAMLQLIERAGRTCYKSEDRVTPQSSREFCRRMIKSGHHSVIEHPSMTVKIITDRGVTHEIVRHRLASYSQESTRYCDYTDGKFDSQLTFIIPVWCSDLDVGSYDGMDYGATPDDATNDWLNAMANIEQIYASLRYAGWSPQQARTVLPNSLKTEIVMTCNIREWRHFFSLRCSKAAHPQMRDLALMMLQGFKRAIPVLFDDVCPEAL